MITNRGRYKLVSVPTAYRKPPNHHLVEVESSLCKNYFANLMFGLRAHITIALQVVLVLHLGRLDGDSLVHHGGEVVEIMNGKSEPEVWVEATTELLLPASISGDLLFRIAREVQEFTLIGFDSHVALSKVAELFRLTVHDPLRNVAGAKSRLKFIPGDDFSNWQ